MGTNFFVNNDAEENEQIHIGRRSAAGPYCWDCKRTLCYAGEEGIHYAQNEWAKSCPSCGQKQQEEKFSDSAAGRELGFNKKPSNKKGVTSCSSFSWGLMPSTLEKELKKATYDKPIVDEYGDPYSKEEFEAVLDECPVQYTHSVGRWFR